MLVLTRKVDEQILIGDDIKITLIRVRGNSVRIGIEAPRAVRVVRGELGLRDAAVDQKMEVEIELDGELDDLAAVFAHPEMQVKRTKPAVVVNRLTANASKAVQPRVFVGTVSRSGAHAKLNPAPLANFVSAS